MLFPWNIFLLFNIHFSLKLRRIYAQICIRTLRTYIASLLFIFLASLAIASCFPAENSCMFQNYNENIIKIIYENY